MVWAQTAFSERQEMQPDGRAEGANASIPVSVVGPGLSTTAAQQRQACHTHQRNFKVGSEGEKRNGFGKGNGFLRERETLLSKQGVWTSHIWHGKEGAAILIEHGQGLGCEGP